MKITSQFFDSILVERQTLQMKTPSNLAYRQITNRVLYKIYDYLLDNKYEIEEEMWLMEHRGHLRIHAIADYDVCITKNLASFNLEINPIYTAWHSVGDLNIPDADHIAPVPLHALRKSKAYGSLFDYYASASKSPILQQPCSSMTSLCASLKEIQLDGADNENSHSQSPSRQSPL